MVARACGGLHRKLSTKCCVVEILVKMQVVSAQTPQRSAEVNGLGSAQEDIRML